MYAVMKTGGKQYRVAPGDVLRIEKIEATEGDTVQFHDVLMLGGDGAATLGTPLVTGAAVQAEVLGQVKGDKVINFVRRRRKHSSKRTKGHRQKLTTVRVTEILGEGAEGTGVTGVAGTRPRTEEVAGTRPRAEKTEKTAPAAGAAPVEAPSDEARPGLAGVVAAGIATAATVATGAGGAAAAAGAAMGADDVPEPVEPTNLMDGPPEGGGDDLTRLKGVGPKLQDKLNANGVYVFAQIAEWGPAEVAAMDEKLAFKGRIARDGWIDQATEFAAEKE